MALAHSTLKRPELTFPEAEADHLRAAYNTADVILEYGSGGSTVLGADMPGKTITSVESDRGWLRMMRRWFKANPPMDSTQVDLQWADIGPTKAWGHPQDDRAWRRFARYPLAVWQGEGFRHPDVVLVDGRFRLGCALATLFSITRPVTLLFDDYKHRTQNHKIETYVGAPLMVGRMAEFRMEPATVPPAKLLEIIRFMLRP